MKHLSNLFCMTIAVMIVITLLSCSSFDDTFCYSCGERRPVYDIDFGEELCADCYIVMTSAKCKGCGILLSRRGYGANGWCGSCYEEYGKSCFICGAMVPADCVISLNNGYYLCVDDASEYLSDDSYILDLSETDSVVYPDWR